MFPYLVGNTYAFSIIFTIEDMTVEERILKSPIKIIFGRPNFRELFNSFVEENPKEFHVYSTTSLGVNDAIFDATQKVTKDSNSKFHHIYEATS